MILVRERAVLRPLVHDGLREPVDELFREEEPAQLPPWAAPEQA